MAWAKQDSDTLGGTADVMTISDLTAKKFVMTMIHAINSGQISGNNSILDNNTNTDYAIRVSLNGAADVTGTSSASFGMSDTASYPFFNIGYWINIDGEEKLNISHTIGQNTAGATNAPTRREYVNKVDTTTNSGQFTREDVKNAGTGDYAANSNLSALGTD